MNREIKFRLWSKQDNQWYNDFFAVDMDGGLTQNGVNDWPFGNEKHYPKKDNWVIQQYTGLKDKNGKEIYEGDILQVKDERTIKKCWKLEVKFGEVDFGRDAYTNCIGFYATEIGYNCEQGLGHPLSYESCLVIGNIFENPELLKNS
jgi:uncharacterized phage protein (TIGR01671 family)